MPRCPIREVSKSQAGRAPEQQQQSGRINERSFRPFRRRSRSDRRGFLIFATVATGAVGAAFAAVPFIASWSPSERARAAGAPVEVDVSKIEPGQMVTVTYRKKAMYIVHRTPEMIGSLRAMTAG